MTAVVGRSRSLSSRPNATLLTNRQSSIDKEARVGDVKDSQADITKAKPLVG